MMQLKNINRKDDTKRKKKLLPTVHSWGLRKILRKKASNKGRWTKRTGIRKDRNKNRGGVRKGTKKKGGDKFHNS